MTASFASLVLAVVFFSSDVLLPENEKQKTTSVSGDRFRPADAAADPESIQSGVGGEGD